MAYLLVLDSKESVFDKLKDLENAYFSESDALLIFEKEGLNLPIIIRSDKRGILIKMDNFPVFIEENFVEKVLLEVAELFKSVEFFNFKGVGFPHS